MSAGLDDDRYAAFYAVVFGRLTRQLRPVVGADAEDVAQEALLVARRRWHVIQAFDAPEAWVRRVALRVAVRRSRREQRRVELETASREPGTDAPLDLDLVAALLDLPDRHAAAIRLHHLEDRPVAEVAAMLGVTEGAAKVTLLRARRVVAERLVGFTGRWVSERQWSIDDVARHLRDAGWAAQTEEVVDDLEGRGGRWELTIRDGTYVLRRDDGARFDHGASRVGRSSFEMAPVMNTGRARYDANIEGRRLSLRFVGATVPPHRGLPEGGWAGIFYDAAPFVRADPVPDPL
ncbi:MAG TPA: sigma-70 family RNA polymerase sigma factor [Candidatus Limnocylindrales bacterium]|nr:sigma-70 family RNA polymerase sigma factor [Candidatus Limnocylindrales bacterium]